MSFDHLEAFVPSLYIISKKHIYAKECVYSLSAHSLLRIHLYDQIQYLQFWLTI